MKTTTEPMNYFAAIVFRVNQIDELAQTYLDKFEFMSNDQVMDRLWIFAKQEWKDKCNSDWETFNENPNCVPDWISNWMDGWVPFAPPSLGSLYDSLAYSTVSMDAHMRNLLERCEGRETKALDFPIMAENHIVNKLSGLS